MSPPAAVTQLRSTLAGRFPDAVPLPQRTAWSVAFGVSALDALLPGGGLPRGRISTASGPGMTALLRAAAASAVSRGERAAWVDAAGLASAESGWAGIALIRPASAVDALVAAEELLRSGGFSLVVVAGPGSGGMERVRMARNAAAGGAAYVELGSAEGRMAAVRLGSRVGGIRWRRSAMGDPVTVEAVEVRVRATTYGWDQEAVLQLPLSYHDLRVALEPELADRRGGR
jgi:hypothetical protein